MTGGDATATGEIFQHERVARGYATARPYLHPEIFASVRAQLGLSGKVRRVLDVGCGTGMSSVALGALAGEVVATDASASMLHHARRGERSRYVAAAAESLPFLLGTFDLVVACGSIDWVDRSRFLPRAAELVASGGFLVSLDFGDTGRSPDVPGLARWYDDSFQTRYPRPSANDPVIGAHEAARCGFEAPSWSDFASLCAFTAHEYAAFLMTESNVIAAIEYGGAAENEVRAWLEPELVRLFGDGARRVAFSGYVQTLRKP